MKTVVSLWRKAVMMIVLLHLCPVLFAQEEHRSVGQDTTLVMFHDKKLLRDLDIIGVQIYNFEKPTITGTWNKKVDVAKYMFTPSSHYPLYQPDNVPFFKGDYKVSAPIYRTRYGVLTGSGRQETYAGLGMINSAGLSYQHQWSDRVSTSIHVSTTKSRNQPFHPVYALGVEAMYTYQMQDNIAFTAFGTYSVSNSFNASNYGGFFSVDVSRKFGVDLGAQRYYDPMRGKWDVAPIVAPYYKYKSKVKIGMDFGGIIQDVARRFLK